MTPAPPPNTLPTAWWNLLTVAIFLLPTLAIWSGCSDSDRSLSESVDKGTEVKKADSKPSENENLFRKAVVAYQRQDYKAAEKAIRGHLMIAPDDLRGLETLGDIAASTGDNRLANESYEEVLRRTDRPTEPFLSKYAMRLMASSRAFDCLAVLEQRVKTHPNHPDAGPEMAGLAAMLGVAEQGVDALRDFAKRGGADSETLQVLADPRRVEPDGEMCQRLLTKNPSDLRPQFGLARAEANQLSWSKVKTRLQPVVQQHPNFLPGQMLYGLALVQEGEFAALPEWRQSVPETARAVPDYWMIAGCWAMHEQKHDEAARAFWEAIRIDSSGYPEALPNLLFSLKQLQRDKEASEVATQINRATALRDSVKTHLERSSLSQSAAFAVSDAMLSMGRIWEAEGWARLAVSLPKDQVTDTRERYLKIRSRMTAQTPWQSPELKLANRLDLSDLPRVTWGPGTFQKEASRSLAKGQIHFRDEASARGLNHICNLATTGDETGHWIYQSVGGGMGVIDFDLDGWPDLALAVLDGQPKQNNSSPNRLMRNLAGQFTEVTSEAEYSDLGFGQGIAVGDYNSDGFPDLFDANIGRNRLYRNNGDGTFTDVSDSVGLQGDSWTTCGLIADINGDGLTDLYEVTYCGGDKPYQQACRNSRGLATCPPLDFEADTDNFWRGSNDGNFTEITTQWAGQTSPGRGLGIVAGMFDERPGLDLYVANDMTVNQFWSGEYTDGEFGMVDLGAIRGLGLSGRSLSQASMGMAVGDPDRDGDIDFFLTHFAGDHNTYYEQAAPGLWVDRTVQRGLAEPSMDLLGFGTEWVDFDNNGAVELLISNGHVDDIEAKDVPYKMPAQLLELDTTGKWQQIAGDTIGDYFSKNHLGRALVTLDANRDGLVDVAISHLYEPLALLVNRTNQAGNEITLHLKSTTGQRDGIGTSVTLPLGDQKITTQLTAGNGYMCSSERTLVIGTGKMTETGDAQVRWASGRTEQFGQLQCGAEYILVEGSGAAFKLASPNIPTTDEPPTLNNTALGSGKTNNLSVKEAESDSE